jgi:DNA (cytosine-5)-methyltransferase 1
VRAGPVAVHDDALDQQLPAFRLAPTARLGIVDQNVRSTRPEPPSRSRPVARRPGYRLIDLFAGIGGMTCGFVQAGRGYEPIFAVEIEESAAAIYESNFGDHIYVGDIAGVEEFPTADVVIGGPPCQGFSPLGRDRDATSRAALNSQWRHFVEALRQAEPSVFVMENVPELLRSAEYVRFKREVGVGGLGYEIAEDVLLAADFGVPQLRRRAIVIGSKLGEPPWPTATHTPETYVTVRQALRGLPLEPHGRSWHRGRPNIRPSSIERYQAVPEGGNRFDLARNRPDLLPRCWAEKPSGTTDVFGRMWWGRPSFTIRTEFYKPEKGRYLHPEAHRPITVREAASLMSFPRARKRPPEGFILPEDLPMVAVAKGLGNAVPPKLARAIAEVVADHLDAHACSQPQSAAAALQAA